VVGAILVAAVVAVAVGSTGTAATVSGPWPDSSVAALWPTFATVPRSESGRGGLRGWDGSFERCRRSARASFAYACEYDDARQNVGYVCLATSGSEATLTAASIDSVVAPADETYGSASPTQVCDSSLAYAMSLGN
jgi:hypothetical protein